LLAAIRDIAMRASGKDVDRKDDKAISINNLSAGG
jgi:hypothetical protein